jgi:hypothetical protein
MDNGKLHIVITPDIIDSAAWDKGRTPVSIYAASYSAARRRRGGYVTIAEDTTSEYMVSLVVARKSK